MKRSRFSEEQIRANVWGKMWGKSKGVQALGFRPSKLGLDKVFLRRMAVTLRCNPKAGSW